MGRARGIGRGRRLHPRFAWSIIGGPFEGKYRKASVIHDVTCVEKARPWQEVHLAFYEAMLADGVGEKKAKVMYAAVYHRGPRWARTESASATTDSMARVEDELAGRMLGDENVWTAAYPLPSAPPCDGCAASGAGYEVFATYTPEAPGCRKPTSKN